VGIVDYAGRTASEEEMGDMKKDVKRGLQAGR
jgi:hypothetical protein